MGLVTKGLQNKLIAAQMGLSEHTVKAHVRNFFFQASGEQSDPGRCQVPRVDRGSQRRRHARETFGEWRSVAPICRMTKTERLLNLVGKLNYTWSNTESLLIYVISDLIGADKETAIVVFLTLNTTLARLDLIERLAKMARTDPRSRAEALSIVAAMKREAKVRNKYTHCIYSFSDDGEIESTQLMRIADFGDDLRYGKMEDLDEAELASLEATIASVVEINHSLMGYVASKGIVM